MCGSVVPLDDSMIDLARRLRREAPESLLASVRTALKLPPNDPIVIHTNVVADGAGVAATNALKAAALLHLSASPDDTSLTPIAMLQRYSAPPA